MPADARLFAVAIPYHAEELYRLLALKCQQSESPDAIPRHTRLLMAALLDYAEAERKDKTA